MEEPQLLISPSAKKSRRSVQKRVVSVPVADFDGGRSKGGGEAAAPPPSDSWAWRKYGQKPIKGSPYPRGYYRCSSSKGCPARKQVERSRVDPTTFTITYSADHDHSWQTTARNHRHHHSSPAGPTPPFPQSNDSKPLETEDNSVISSDTCQLATDQEERLTDLTVGDDSVGLMTTDSFGWFAQVSSPSSNSPTAASDAELFCSPMLGFDECDKLSGAAAAAADEEEDALFAGLGELPECSVVFRRGFLERQWRGGEDGGLFGSMR